MFFSQDRSSRAGGVATYVKDHLNCTVALSKSIPKQFESAIAWPTIVPLLESVQVFQSNAPQYSYPSVA